VTQHAGTDNGAQVRNNIVCNSAGTNLSVMTQNVSNNLTASCPAFANAAGTDFHLASGSIAIDQGTTLAEVPTDKDGVTRPQGSAYDIGAYEFGQSAPVLFLPPPTNVRITNYPNGGTGIGPGC
jgi:hypothetical protein